MKINTNEFKECFPFLDDPEFIIELQTHAQIQMVKPGDVLVESGGYVKFIPLLFSGIVKVSRIDAKGEVLLYFLKSGETCTMTLQCCTSEAPSQVRAVVDEGGRIIKIPAIMMQKWFREYFVWQQYVLNTYQSRFNALLNSLDQLVFDNLEDRVWKLLRLRCEKQGKVLNITHQEIAMDLNSSREVVSRILKKFERSNKLILYRNKIELI